MKLPNWNCPKKQLARKTTIIEPCMRLFGPRLPTAKQYWTISGRCATNGVLNKGCEYDQLISSGFIQPEQFFGVEADKDIFLHNKPLNGPTWINNDFLSAMRATARENNFNPGVVNFDSLFMPERGSAYLARIFSFLTQLDYKPLIFVCNFVCRTSHHRVEKTGEDIIQELNKHKLFTNNYDRWHPFEQKSYQYNGTGKRSVTVMRTVIFKR